MDNLEITTNSATGISEAPLQMKANCGTLLIDDFGRQRVSATELLNRWIVPLEKRYDFLNLANGRKIQVPFDQLIIFSTNLEPRQLVDEAFLRRIPYKIDVADPTRSRVPPHVSRSGGRRWGSSTEEVVDYLIEKHYRGAGRGARFCHPRDLLHQVRTYCDFLEQPLELTRPAVDAAVKNYFAVMNASRPDARRSVADCSVAVPAIAEAGLPSPPMLELTARGRKHRGHAALLDPAEVLLLGRDGRLWRFAPGDVTGFHKTSDHFSASRFRRFARCCSANWAPLTK